VTATLFWIFRAGIGFAAIGCLAFAWRVSVVLIGCLLADLLSLIVAGYPGSSFWTQGRWLFLIGGLLGLLFTGRRADSIWVPFGWTLSLSAMLSVSWLFDATDVNEFAASWPLSLIRIVALPLGMLGSSAMVQAIRSAAIRQ
jgi:hypothetical protein